MNHRLLTFYFAARGYVLAALLGVWVRARMLSAAPLRWDFLALVIAGIILRLWAGAHLGGHGNSLQAQSPALRNSGPYRFSRNPLYIANILTGAGLVLFANCFPLWFAILSVSFLFAHHVVLIHWEEKKLGEQWGDAYDHYVRSTPRWLGWNRSRDFREESSPQWNKVLIWQGRNLVYTVLSVLLLWGATRWK